ncbi:hypothetical protein CSC12_4408 [Klebsiella michiganensis]|nr:hypothetical protein CSC12_4408 [Klebsiella michiganensis]
MGDIRGAANITTIHKVNCEPPRNNVIPPRCAPSHIDSDQE